MMYVCLVSEVRVQRSLVNVVSVKFVQSGAHQDQHKGSTSLLEKKVWLTEIRRWVVCSKKSFSNNVLAQECSSRSEWGL